MRTILVLAGLFVSVCLVNACTNGAASLPPHPLAATHFSISAPANATTGSAFNFTVTALDASNNPVTSYSGTVHFTSTDAQAVLPGNSPLTNGTGIFSATFKTAGNQSISATDTVTTSISSTSNSISVAGSATHFSLNVPSAVTTDVAFTIGVTALDASNNTVTTYSGTVHFTSTDAQASLPANSMLTNGTGSFPFTLKTVGNQTITATDTIAASITNTSNSIKVVVATPTQFSVTSPFTVIPGRTFSLTVSALDAANNLAPSYSGVVHFTSTDPQAVLPVNSTLTNGTGTFSATLNTLGSQTVTATDTVKTSITGTTTIKVANLTITSGAPPNGTVGAGYGGFNQICLFPPGPGFQGFEFDASGGNGGYTWSASSLPPGLQIQIIKPNHFPCAHGVLTFISGIPTAAGTYNVVVTVKDSELPPATASAAYTIIIDNPSRAVAKSAHAVASPQHHHYKLIDLGTFGGPQSYFDDLHLTDIEGFNTVFYNFSQILNSNGVLVGFADTPTPDLNSTSPIFCYVPDCFVTHAFQWQNGVKTDLSALPGGESSAAFWINSNGLIAGNSQNSEFDPVIPSVPELRAVIWKDGKIRDLGTLGGSSSFSQAVNDRGQVTGLALNDVPDPFSFYYEFLYCNPALPICPANATETRGFVWDAENGMQDIGTLGGPDAFPSLINNHGQIAGFSYTDSTSQPTTGLPTLHPFLWEKGKGMKDLGSLGGTNTASVNGLNERGEVVGGAYLPGDVIIHPFLWGGEKLLDLVAPPFGGSADGEASWINEEGEVVGSAGIPMPCPGSNPPREAAHAFLWKNNVMTDLGALPGNHISEANFINSNSQIVGDSWPCDFSTATAFLWEDGSLVDLNALVPQDSQLYMFTASFISDRGEIGAFGALPDGDSHAVLLIPCDENHPGIEGCDYSLVDASDAQGQAAQISPTSATSPATLSPAETMARIRSIMARYFRRFGTRQIPPDPNPLKTKQWRRGWDLNPR